MLCEMTEHEQESLFRVLSLLADGQRDDAASLYFDVVSRSRPKQIGLTKGCGAAALQCGDFAGALRFGQKAIKQAPRDEEAHQILGLAYRRHLNFSDAAASFRRAVQWKPDFVDAWNNLAMTLEDLNDLEAALEAVDSGLAIEDDDIDLLNLKGSILCSMGRPDEGIAVYRQTLRGEDDLAFVRMNIGEALLQTGQTAEGWEEFSYRTELLPPPPVDTERWEGQDLAGKSIVVWHEQGLGDSIQFSRFLPALADQAESVTFVSQERVIALLETLDAKIEITETTYRPFDFQCPLLTLARYLESAREPPYLKSTGSAHPIVEKTTGLKVGIVYAGNPNNPTNRRRSIEPSRLRPLLKVPEVSFFDLGTDDQLSGPNVHSIGIEINNLTRLAATIESLDLVITVDTLAAHLAGALGIPVWNLLAFSPDWRWGLLGDRTKWYPSMRLFRQTKPGDWAGVIDDVRVELCALAQAGANAGQ